MTIEKILNEKTLTLKLVGKLDSLTAPELETVLAEILPGITELVFDFDKLDYISSAGLRLLLTAQKKMNRQGRMKVTNVNETISGIFEVTGFSEILTVE